MRRASMITATAAATAVTALALVATFVAIAPRLVESEEERVVRLAVECLERVEASRARLTPAADMAYTNRCLDVKTLTGTADPNLQRALDNAPELVPYRLRALERQRHWLESMDRWRDQGED